MFGLGGEEASVRITARTAAAPAANEMAGDESGIAKEILDTLLRGMGFNARVEARAADEPDAFVLNIEGNDLGVLIGRRGETLHDLERMSQDPQFVQQLVKLFAEDSSQLLMKIEETLSKHRQEEFKSHVHALKGSALNLGAERLFAHCAMIGALDYRKLDASAGSLVAETRVVIKQTQAALADYVKNRSSVASS